MAIEPIKVGSVTLDPVLVLLVLAGLAVLALIALAIALIVHMRAAGARPRRIRASWPSSKGGCKPSPRSAWRARATSPAPSMSGSTA